MLAGYSLRSFDTRLAPRGIIFYCVVSLRLVIYSLCSYLRGLCLVDDSVRLCG